jgi:hypothetical protein
VKVLNKQNQSGVNMAKDFASGRSTTRSRPYGLAEGLAGEGQPCILIQLGIISPPARLKDESPA